MGLNLQQKIEAKLGTLVSEPQVFCGDLSFVVSPANLVGVMQALRSSDLGFQLLMMLTAVDYRKHPSQPRFEVIYEIYSELLASYVRLRVAAIAVDNYSVPTVSSIWQTALWLEREVYDMFGVNFIGHPNLSRILMHDSHQGYPLRKDYPLHGPPEWPLADDGKRHRRKELKNADR